MTTGSPSSPSTVRIVVLSDIHATEAGKPPTNVSKATAADLHANALTAAKELVSQEFGAADVVLCPGDLVHEGVTTPMDWVWEELHATATALNAELVGAVGNHDLLLKPTGAQTPADALRALNPEFPYNDKPAVRSYWSEDFAIVETAQWRVVTLNSCGQHGGYDKDEAEHGRLRSFCLENLKTELAGLAPAPPVNVCMVHHQPQEWTHRGDKQTNHMLEGDLLIDLLDQRPERWFLLHGHKHHPALGYVGNGTAGPVKLASGSLGADLLGDTGVTVRNQLHVVEFDLDARQLGLVLAGQIRCYDWEPGYGWTTPGPRSGLPARAAFGYRRDGDELAAALLAEAEKRDLHTWTWDDIVAFEPRCAYLTPDDRDALLAGARRLGAGVQQAGDPDDFLEVTFTW